MRLVHSRRTWRLYDAAERRAIAAQCARPGCIPCCPRCGDVLEARPASRIAAARGQTAGFDLDCRDCRRFVPYPRTVSAVARPLSRAALEALVPDAGGPPASTRGLRLRRLAAAVLAV